MPEQQLFVTVSPARGYVAVHPEMSPVVALSLDGIRRKIEGMSLSDKARVILQLDHSARVERDRRRRILQQLQEMQQMHVADRDRIRRELGK